MTPTPISATPPITARVLWWLRNRARPTGPDEGRLLLALIDDLEAGRERHP